MSTVVSTGQITIVDNNDARPITAFITASQGTQQIHTKDESFVSSTPDWSVTPNVLSAKVYVGGTSSAIDVTNQVTNRKWSNNLSTSIGSGTTLTVNTNMDPAVLSQRVYYFEADYTDPTTSLVSHIVAQITLSVVRTGTNAVYLLPRGTSAIQQADGSSKNVAAVAVDLIRAAGVDTTGITYRFYENNGSTQITNSMNSKYGLKTTSPTAQPTGTASNIGTGLPSSGGWSSHNTLIIHESAVADIGVYRAEAKDADGNIFQCYFTVYDVSDPYDLKLISTAGEKLQNGIGATNVYPLVWNGANQLSTADTANWSFRWYFFDGEAPGNRAGFINTTRTAVAGGRNITANTAGAGSVITYSGAAITFAAGDMVKLVKADGTARYYEVASGSTTSNLTLRTATISTFLNAPWPASAITANEFVGGKLYVCTGSGSTAGMQTTTGTGSSNFITVTGDEIDGKGTILCEAIRP
jgi:hypothetical protein